MNPTEEMQAAAIKRLEALFLDAGDAAANRAPDARHRDAPDQKCDAHDKGSRSRSLGNISHAVRNRSSVGIPTRKKEPDIAHPMGPRRVSMPALNLHRQYRSGSLALPHLPPLHRDLEHPSQFSSTLRQSALGSSTECLRREGAWNRHQVPLQAQKRRGGHNASVDSLLEGRRPSWGSQGFEDGGHRGGVGGGCKPTTLESGDKPDDSAADGRPRFTAVASLEDVQAVRCADFHPSGAIYAVGSNSKTLRICAYPKVSDLRENHQTYQPTVLFKRTKHHKGSIYCLAWSPVGDLLATGSNDKTVKLMRFDVDASNVEGDEVELAMHDGTVRDVCFLEDGSNKASLLISGGAGDCKIYVTDCATGTPFQALSGHTGHVLSLYTWGGAMFVSGSHDRTVRFWDLRAKGCVDVVTPTTTSASAARHGSPVAALCVDPSGRLLVSGHEDGACVLYDIRGGRGVQCFRPHAADVRSVRFSPSAYYLLSAGYDNKLVLTDLQGDLTLPLPSVVVAQHEDKAISARWHPSEFSFVSTSADKTATLWALPPV